jgi:hypothetical protein
MVNLEALAEQTLAATLTLTATPTPTVITLTPSPTVITVTPATYATPAPQGDGAPASLMAVGDPPPRYFEVQAGSPVTMPNWAHPSAGCNWLGVAGQVFNLAGTPEANLIIEVAGTLDGEPVLGLALTGLESIYGPGGYEVQMADQPVASSGDVSVQVKNATGQSLSDPVGIETFEDCQQNLILLNFVETQNIPTPDFQEAYLPLILHNAP